MFLHRQTLISPDIEDGADFGFSVGISGSRIIVGANDADHDDGSFVSDAGEVYVFERSGALFSNTATLQSSIPSFNDNYGTDIDIDGDRIIVGAPESVGGAPAPGPYIVEAGAAFIYEYNAGAWDETMLYASDPAADDEFGQSVAIDGTFAIVGAFTAETGALSNSGSAYVFESTGTGWSEVGKLTASDAQNFDRFSDGTVAVSGDVFAVGCKWQDDPPDNQTGMVYVYNYSRPLPVELSDFTAQLAQEQVLLEWQTATEIHNRGFEVQRAEAADADFETLEFVTGAGNSQRALSYSEVDANVVPGNTYYYRLVQEDFDGTRTPSPVVQVYVPESGEQSLQLYPNPTADRLVITSTQPLHSIVVRSSIGQVVMREDVVESTQTRLDVAHLPAGVYLLQTDGQALRFVKE